MPPMTLTQWDLFCRVVDNLGDVGVCWRLAADLASRGERVRLWIDDASPLTWMAPRGVAGVEVLPWPADDAPNGIEADPVGRWSRQPPDRVIEAFGCDLPDRCLALMRAMPGPPVWIDLEYLSAEAYVERSHGLPSPQASGPAAGMTKWFFYPGFTPRTGGLIREPGLAARQQAFDAEAWLRGLGLAREPGERIVSLFCYEQPALEALIDELATAPTLLLAAAGVPARQVRSCLGPTLRRGALRALPLPWLTQTGYDELLWASDLNFVRGEDSFVRAQWAAKPFVWQPYPQSDGAHRPKLDAFLDLFDASAEPAVATRLRALSQAWSRGAGPWPGLPTAPAWRAACESWRSGLQVQTDLTGALRRFAAEAG